MMQVPAPEELQHFTEGIYDPAKAHDYYEKHKHLKGRHRGSTPPVATSRSSSSTAKVRQKAELQARVTNLSRKLNELERLIQKKEAVLKRDQGLAKSTAKKERAAKEKHKPKTAAEKAKAARENKQYRQKHKQTLKTKQKHAGSGGGSAKKGATKPSEMHIADLKALAIKVKGQLAVAKQKLAAL